MLPFVPYTASQIASIITARLQSLLPDVHNAPQNYIPFFQPAAIQLCSRKVASQTGDLRKAFDLIRRTLDLVERETQQKVDEVSSSFKAPLLENMNLSLPLSPPTTPTSKQLLSVTYTATTAPRATVAHIARISSVTFGNGTTQRVQALNLQQKAALCALIALGRKQREANSIFRTPPKSPQSAAPTVKRLFDAYWTLCRKDNVLHPLTATEFKDVVSSLETMGLVGEVHGRARCAVTGGSSSMRTPSRTCRGLGTLERNRFDEKGLVCYVGEKELEGQISGAGEGILRSMLHAEGL